MFSDDVRITIIESEKKVSFSVRLNENTVIVKTMSLAEFKIQFDKLREVFDKM